MNVIWLGGVWKLEIVCVLLCDILVLKKKPLSNIVTRPNLLPPPQKKNKTNTLHSFLHTLKHHIHHNQTFNLFFFLRSLFLFLWGPL